SMAKTMTATMRAVAVTPMRAGSARQVQLPIPTVAREMAVMRVLEVGIDGTDTEINGGLYGEAPPGSDFLVIGHEALSVVEAVGEGVQGFRPGDLVVSTVRRPDDCPNCRAGESDMCLFGRYTERGIKGAHGYMGDYYGETPAFMVKIPPGLRPFAVLLEPLSIVEKATYQAWKIQERMLWAPKRAVVLGAGPIGMLATILLRLRGVSRGNRSVEIPADVINLEMVLGNRVTFGSVNANRRYFEMGVQHFQQAEQRWPGIFERLITRRVPFADFTSALDRRPEDIKTLLTIADA